MPLPFLQSYNDPKIEKAYRLYLAGTSQRKIVGKVKGLPQRTLARYCKNDGWEDERRARKIAGESPNVAAVAAEVVESAAKQPKGAANPDAQTVHIPEVLSPLEPRNVRMDRMLDRQQRIVGRLVDAYERDVEKTLTDDTKLTRSQIAQLTTLGNNLLTMERKAWCVPDKIETKDTTPATVDSIRNLKDDELERRDRELDEQLAASERRKRSAEAGEAPPASVN